MFPNANKNRWACPGAAKRFIIRSRTLVGWWEFSARLSSQPMSSVATKAVGGSCWLRNGRCLGARGDSCFGYRDMAKTLGFEGHIAWAEAMP